MTAIVEVHDAGDPRLSDYQGLTDVRLRRSRGVAQGLFMAEGEKVIRRAAAAGYPVRSLLVTPARLAGLGGLAIPAGVPVYLVPPAVAEQVTGYQVQRGALAAMARKPLPAVAEVLAGCGPRSRVIVLEDLVDHGNVGAIFRSAAALGVAGVVLSPRCCWARRGTGCPIAGSRRPTRSPASG